jgi:hypothetical protein
VAAAKLAADAPSNPNRIKLLRWSGNVFLHEASSQRTLVLGGPIDLGGSGSCKVADLEYDTATGLVWYTIVPNTPGVAPIRYFLKDSGVAEPVE